MIHQLGDIETAGVTINKQNVVESTRMTPGCPLLRNSRKIIIPTVARRSIGKFQFGIGIAYIPESRGFGRYSAAGHFPEPIAAAVAESLVPCKIRDRSLRMEKLVLRFCRRTDRRARLRGSGIYRRKVFSARQIRSQGNLPVVFIIHVKIPHIRGRRTPGILKILRVPGRGNSDLLQIEKQEAACAFIRDEFSTGSNTPARTAITAIVSKSSRR